MKYWIRRHYKVGVVFALLLAFTQSRADISTDQLFNLSMEELFEVEVEIATGKLQPLSKAPAVASVITAADIAALGITEFSQILAMVPGVHLYSDPIGRLDPHFSIRGIQTVDNAQVLVLINGHDFSSIVTGSTPFNFRLPVAAISRVEVMKSPGSALYGADAFAGVINIITKEASEIDGTQFGWRAGSFDTQDVWLLHAGKLNEAWSFIYTLETSRSDGDRGRVIEQDGAAVGTGYAPGALDTRYDIFSSRIALTNDHWDISLWNWSTENAGVGQGAAQMLDPTGTEELDLYLFDVQHNVSDLVSGWNFNTRYSHEFSDNLVKFTIFPPDSVLPVGDDGNIFTPHAGCPAPPNLGCPALFSDGVLGNPGLTVRKNILNFSADYSGFEQHRFLFGLGVKHIGIDTSETKNFGPGVIDSTTLTTGPPPFTVIDGTLTNVTATENIYLEKNSRTVQHLFFQDEWAIDPNWTFTAGVRYDDYSDFGNTTNPRFALVWSASQNLTTKFLAGRAFRAPSFGELFFQKNPSVLGNENLSPETIETLELVFDYRSTQQFNTVLSLFSYEIKNLINRIPSPMGVVAQNSGEQDGQGFELESNWHVSSKLQLRGYYAYQDSENPITGEVVADAPKHQIYINVHWGIGPDWFLGSQLKWIGDRKRQAADSRSGVSEVADYTLVDLTLRRRGLLPNMELAVSARNIFDEDAREPSPYNPVSGAASIPNDYPLPGRSFYAEIAFHY